MIATDSVDIRFDDASGRLRVLNQEDYEHHSSMACQCRDFMSSKTSILLLLFCVIEHPITFKSNYLTTQNNAKILMSSSKYLKRSWEL